MTKPYPAYACTKTPTHDCVCRACKSDEMLAEFRWLGEMEGSGAMAPHEHASRLAGLEAMWLQVTGSARR